MRQRRERQPKPPSYPAEQMLFAEWLRQQLRSSRLTGAELADRARISKASAYFYLDGSRIPGPDAVLKLCAALRLRPENIPAFERRAVGRPAHRRTEVAADVCSRLRTTLERC
jgi:transcriptional regulator with XRE-family HTH domain